MEVEGNMSTNQYLPYIEKRQYMCDICENIFKTEQLLRRHYNVIHNMRKTTKWHRCNICSKAFSYAHNLKMHIHTIHESKKEYKCEYCGKLFAEPGNLKLHISTVQAF